MKIAWDADKSWWLLFWGTVAVQLAQGCTWYVDNFTRSYWMVTYEYGFVRRGLGGEVLRHVPEPFFPSMTALLVVCLATGVAAAGALIALGVRLFREGTTAARVLALALVASPAGVDLAFGIRRPDEFGLALLIASGFAMIRGNRGVLALCGLGWAAGVLVHEAGLLRYGVWLVPLGLVVAAEERLRRKLALLLGPAVVALATVLMFGRADADQQAALYAYGQPLVSPSASVVKYLADSMTTSLDYVGRMPFEAKALMLASGAVLVALTIVLVVASGVRFGRDVFVALAVPLAGALGLFATGVDWGRWFASLSLGLIVLACFSALVRPQSARMPSWLAVPIALLALLPAFPGYLGPGF